MSFFLQNWMVQCSNVVCEIRYCKRMWLAAYRGLYQLGGFLPVWKSSCCSSWFLGKSEREGSVDWHPNRGFRADAPTLDRHEPNKLERTGPNLPFQILLMLISVLCFLV